MRQPASAKTAAPTRGKQQTTIIIAAVVVVAVIAVGALILLSGQTQASATDYSTIPQSRAADGGFVLGDPDAPITIVEFADYACPSCQQYKGAMDRLVSEYVATGQAKFEFRVFPTAGGALTDFAGRIAECIADAQPGSYWQVHDTFYQLAMSGQYSDQMGRIVAERMGLDYSQILDCAGRADQVDTDTALGRRLGVSGTPAVMVRYGNSEPTFVSVGGATYDRGSVPFEALAQVIEDAQ
jgi:protein-disulfide isomerase